MRPINNQVYNKAMKVAKRIAITIACCLPVLLLFGYFTQNIITNNALQILCFIGILGVAVLVEEIIARKAIKRKEALDKIEPKRDVFK